MSRPPGRAGCIPGCSRVRGRSSDMRATLNCRGRTRRSCTMAADGKQATDADEVTRLVAERLNAGDVDGILELYEADAVLAYPPESPTMGVEAIRAIYQAMAEQNVQFSTEEKQLPTIYFEDLALTSTVAADGTGMRVQVLRKQDDGTWKRIIDRPEVT